MATTVTRMSSCIDRRCSPFSRRLMRCRLERLDSATFCSTSSTSVALGLGPASPPACAVRVSGSVCRWRAESKVSEAC